MNLDEVQEGRIVKYRNYCGKSDIVKIGIIAYVKNRYVYVRFIYSENLMPIAPVLLEYKYKTEPEEIVKLNKELEKVLFKINKFKNRKFNLINHMILEKLYEDRREIFRKIIEVGGDYETE